MVQIQAGSRQQRACRCFPEVFREQEATSYVIIHDCINSRGLIFLFQDDVRRGLQKLIVRLPAQDPPPESVSYSGYMRKVVREAQELQRTMHDFYVAQDHLLLALLKDSEIQKVLKECGLNEATLKTAIEQMRGNRRVESKTAEQGFDALQKYAVDLTARAEEGKIDPVIGRDNEIRRVIRILCRR